MCFTADSLESRGTEGVRTLVDQPCIDEPAPAIPGDLGELDAADLGVGGVGFVSPADQPCLGDDTGSRGGDAVSLLVAAHASTRTASPKSSTGGSGGYEIMATEAAYKQPIWPTAGDRKQCRGHDPCHARFEA